MSSTTERQQEAQDEAEYNRRSEGGASFSDEDRLSTGTGTLTIELDGNPAQETLEHIAGLIEQGMTSGYYPTWEVSAMNQKAEVQDAYDRGYRAGAQRVPEFHPGELRDLWEDNMPRVSGCMYFAIPGEQPIHVSDDEARHIIGYLSEVRA